ncbi:unnamed protein product [Miscanthus lutarioriparius]|uniref:Transposase (putative) gypsy type domain-containing protein n=1 Tax=Miscanthus lutarioriparius TaxID=422564 RepID=A0A811MNM6_9POAL|nr:unnamed protein product [Miscanthus lutarioriparius]
MAAASSVVELCTLANAKLDAATWATFFNDDDGAGAISSFSWPEVERTPSRLTSQTALQALCEKYQVPADYIPINLDSHWVACRPPPEGSNAICVYADALEAGMRIPLHEFYVAILGHYGLAPSQLAPDAWRYMAAFVLLCKDAGVEPTLRAFRSFFSICTHKAGPYFESHSGVTTGLFTARFFHLRSPSTMPWPCAVKWGKPSRAAVRLPEVTWDTVVKKLLERAGGSAIDVIEFLSRRSPPVVAPPQDAPRDRVRLTFTPQQKHKLASELAKKAMTELDEKGKELQATRGEVAHLKEQVRAVRDKHAGDVAQLKEALSVANAHHAYEVRRLAEEHHKARTAHGEETKAERASVVAKLQEEHADGVARLKEKHAADVAKLQDDVARLKEDHAADVARVKDAADKEVQDAKKNIVLRLFPKLDVSLLERPKLKGDLAAAGMPKAQGRS